MAANNDTPQNPAKQQATRQLLDQRNRLAYAIENGAINAGLFKPADRAEQSSRNMGNLIKLAEATGESAAQKANDLNKLATAVSDAAYDAGMLNPGVGLSGPQLLMLIKDMGEAAKATVGRNEMLAKLERSGDRIITDADAMESLKRLDKSYYRNWRDDTMDGFDKQGIINGNVPVGDIALVGEFARRQLIEHSGMVASPTPTSQDEREAIEHALDVLSQHGDGFTSVGAMETLQGLLDRTASPANKKANTQSDGDTDSESAGAPMALTPHWKKLKETFDGYRRGDVTVHHEDFVEAMNQFTHHGIHGDAANDLSEEQKDTIKWARGVLQSSDIRYHNSLHVMGRLEEVIHGNADNRTPAQKQAAQNDQATLDDLVTSTPEDSPLAAKAKQLLADIDNGSASPFAQSQEDQEAARARFLSDNVDNDLNFDDEDSPSPGMN